MQFKKINSKSGSNVQVLKSVYDSTKKRCVQKLVLTIKGHYSSYEMPSDEQMNDAGLSADEQTEVKFFVEQETEKKAKDNQAFECRYAASQIRGVVKSVPHMSADEAKAVYEAWAEVKAALVKAGHRRPKPTKEATEPAQVEANQGDLLNENSAHS